MTYRCQSCCTWRSTGSLELQRCNVALRWDVVNMFVFHKGNQPTQLDFLCSPPTLGYSCYDPGVEGVCRAETPSRSLNVDTSSRPLARTMPHAQPRREIQCNRRQGLAEENIGPGTGQGPATGLSAGDLSSQLQAKEADAMQTDNWCPTLRFHAGVGFLRKFRGQLTSRRL